MAVKKEPPAGRGTETDPSDSNPPAPEAGAGSGEDIAVEAAGGASEPETAPEDGADAEDPESPPLTVGGAEAPLDDDDSDDEAAAAAGELKGAPIWIAGLTVISLVLVYLGQRILLTHPTAQWVTTCLGGVGILTATGLRFSPRLRGTGELRSISRLLAVLTVLIGVALAIYFSTTDWFADRLGLSSLSPETHERVEDLLTIVWIALLAASLVPLLFGEAAMYPMRRAERPERRRVRAAVAAGLSLVLTAIYGSLFVYAAQAADITADFSYFKTSRPSESTRKIAETLKQPVTVYAFFPPVSEARNEVSRYLNELASQVPTVQVRMEDRFLVPKLARELGVRQEGTIVISRDKVKERVAIGTEMKQARPKLRTLDRDFQKQLFKFVRDQRIAYLTTGHGEINDKASRRGEGAHDAAKGVREVLGVLNYRVKNLGTPQGLAKEVPDDADLVLVLGPSDAFLPEELDSLERYARGGGRLFISFTPDSLPNSELGGLLSDEPSQPGAAASGETNAPAGSAAPKATAAPAASASAAASARPTSSANPEGSEPSVPDAAPKATAGPAPAVPAAKDPNAALARLVGLQLGSDLLANSRYYLPSRYGRGDQVFLRTNRFSSHASVSTLSRKSQEWSALFIGAGSLEAAPGSKFKVDFTVRAMPGTWADANRNLRFDKATEKQGAFNLCAAVTAPVSPADGEVSPEANPKQKDSADEHETDADKSETDHAAQKEMRAYVMADTDALTTEALGFYVPNQFLFADAIRWLGGEESFAGEFNSEEDVRIEHTKQEDLVWFYSTIFGVPVLVLAVGLVVSRRSRHHRSRKRRPAAPTAEGGRK